MIDGRKLDTLQVIEGFVGSVLAGRPRIGGARRQVRLGRRPR